MCRHLITFYLIHTSFYIGKNLKKAILVGGRQRERERERALSTSQTVSHANSEVDNTSMGLWDKHWEWNKVKV